MPIAQQVSKAVNIERARIAMLEAYEHTGPAAGIHDAVADYVAVFLDFLAGDYAFLRLIQREALADASRVEELFGQPVQDTPRVRPGG